MKTGITIFLLLGMSTNLSASGGGTRLAGALRGYPDSILQSIENANVWTWIASFILVQTDRRVQERLRDKTSSPDGLLGRGALGYECFFGAVDLRHEPASFFAAFRSLVVVSKFT